MGGYGGPYQESMKKSGASKPIWESSQMKAPYGNRI